MKTKFFKKMIAVGLAVSSLFAMFSTTTVFADDSIENIGYKEVGKEEIPNDILKFYTTGIDDTKSFMTFVGEKKDNSFTINFSDCIDVPKTLVLPNDDTYRVSFRLRYKNRGSFGVSDIWRHSYSNLGGLYKKVKVKLSDIYPTYFNTDGTHTNELFDNVHDYNFSEEDGYTSNLIFESGAAFTEVRPDKNGEAEIWVSRQIGDITEINTNFQATGLGDTGNTTYTGGGVRALPVDCLMCGNADLSKAVDIKDATIIQQYIAGLTEFVGLSKFNSDVDNNGTVNISDVTEIQKYLARL